MPFGVQAPTIVQHGEMEVTEISPTHSCSHANLAFSPILAQINGHARRKTQAPSETKQ